MFQCPRLHFHCSGTGWIPDQGTKILHAKGYAKIKLGFLKYKIVKTVSSSEKSPKRSKEVEKLFVKKLEDNSEVEETGRRKRFARFRW